MRSRRGTSRTLLDLIPTDLKEPFDPREVIALVADGVSADNGVVFDEFKPLYGSSLVTGWARIHGHQVGILANAQGVLFSEEAQKATQFIQLANQIDVPLLFLHNTTGYMVGKEYEQGGIIKHGAQMINAVSNSKVPHISIIMGASYGAGNYGMNGRAFDPRFLFTWPSAKSAVMGPAQLAGVLSIVARAAAEAKGKEYDDAADAGHARVRRGQRRGAEPAVLPLRDAVRRRRDRPARHPDDPRHLPVRDHRQPARRGHRAASGCSGHDATIKTDSWSPTAARSPAGSSRPAAGSASRRSPCTPTRTPACRSSARPTPPYGCPATAPPRPTCAPTWCSRQRGGPGADAIHPGYGFLSENADFARAVIAAGITWVGPAPESIEQMGSKIESKKLMDAAGVPVLTNHSRRDRHRDGPAAAGEGIGRWRRSRDARRTHARRPARRDRQRPRPRRSRPSATAPSSSSRTSSRAATSRCRCSVTATACSSSASVTARSSAATRRWSRRRPRPNLADATRHALHEAARAAAAAIDYRGAGTVEFLYDAETERFFFLEMNTRLQVEHPVTELVHGVDLVEAQLAVAEGRRARRSG